MKMLNTILTTQIVIYIALVSVLYYLRDKDLGSVTVVLFMTIGAFLLLGALAITLIIFGIVKKRLRQLANRKTLFLLAVVIALTILYMPVLSFINSQSVFGA
ncbi:MAG TPA: hypothetical protein VFI74_05670 [Candidatus Saccharimonadales bacterium]|nr:hypothetical protein [Candidatus Saccharimonadales bacterium]